MNLIKTTKTLMLCSVLTLNISAKEEEIKPVELVVSVLVKPKVDHKQEFKQKTLFVNQSALFFTTLGKDPWIKINKENRDEIHSLQLSKDLENPTVLRKMVNGIGGNYKEDRKYFGQRTNIIGKGIEYLLFQNSQYEGTILVDEYKEQIPMVWNLKNAQELEAVCNYLAKHFEEKNIKTTEKTLLILQLENDKNLKTVNAETSAFLNKYFEIFSATDEDLMKFFKKSKELIIDSPGKLKDPDKNETILEGIVREVEKANNKFKAKDVAIAIGAVIAAKLSFDFAGKVSQEAGKFKEGICTKIFGKDKDKKDITSIRKGVLGKDTIAEYIIEKTTNLVNKTKA